MFQKKKNKRFISLANIVENTRCEKNLLDEELNRQKAKLIINDEQKSLPIKQRSNSNERLQKQSLTTIIKS